MRHTLARPHGPAKAGAVASAVIAAALGLATAGCPADGQPTALPQASCGTGRHALPRYRYASAVRGEGDAELL